MARPTTFDGPATDAIRVRVTPEQRRDLEAVAKTNGLSVSAVIREAVNSFVGDYGDRSVFVVHNGIRRPH